MFWDFTTFPTRFQPKLDLNQMKGQLWVFFILQNHAINLRVFGKSPGPLALGDEDLALFSHQWFQPRYIPPMGGRIERSLGNKALTSSKLSSLSSSIQRIQSMCFLSDLILFFQIFDVGMSFSSFSRFSPAKPREVIISTMPICRGQ